MKPQFIDTHTHLDAEAFNKDREAVIKRAQDAGVTRFITIGASDGIASSHRALALAEQYDFIWATAGIHPHDAACKFDPAELATLAKHERVVAIGETGLDFYLDWCPEDKQREAFSLQIDLAKAVKKPLVIHSREAGEACYQTLVDMRARDVGGVFHCYSEDAAFAEKLRELNFHVSVPGSLTFKKADALRDTFKEIPLEQIMLETDAPYLAPTPYRGKRCESAFVIETAKMLAEVKEVSLEEIAKITSQTAEQLFNLPAQVEKE